MKSLQQWVRLPTAWIEAGGLKEYRWSGGKGSNNLAALMALTAISHHVDEATGVARLTYDELCEATTLSRAKLSAALQVLVERNRIERSPTARSYLKLPDYNVERGWAQFPASRLYDNGTIYPFHNIKLRQVAELDAMKLYFLFASRRDRATNFANITFEKIEEYCGVDRNGIKRALSWLAAQGMVHIERIPSRISTYGYSSAYRLAHLDTRRHMGTTGRDIENLDVDPHTTIPIPAGRPPSPAPNAPSQGATRSRLRNGMPIEDF